MEINISNYILCTVVFCLPILCLESSQAMVLTPNSYDMPNGDTGSYNYWDKNYTGNGETTQDGAILSGGLGDLTDGIIVTNVDLGITENTNPPGEGPYVGWGGINPTITFNFTNNVNLNKIELFLDDRDGLGGVDNPAGGSLAMGDEVLVFDISEPSVGEFGRSPFVFTLDDLDFFGNSLDLTLNRQNNWIFMSEVKFYGDDMVDVPVTSFVLPAIIGFIGSAVREHKKRLH